MKNLQKFHSTRTSSVPVQSPWIEIPEAKAELISGGSTGDGPYCDPDKGYVLPPWYIIGNEGGQEGEYSGKQNW